MEEIKRYGIIYKITNLMNGKVYIGQTIKKNPINRFKEHIKAAKYGNINHFHNAIRCYGKENFIFEVIHECYSQDEINKTEAFYIEKYGSCNEDKGYNVEGRSKDGRIYVTEVTREKLRLIRYKPENLLKSSNAGKASRGKSLSNSQSKYCGVNFKKNKWCVSIRSNKKQIHLGYFLLEEDAAKAYDIKALELFGYDCRLNFEENRESYLKGEIIVNKCNRKKSNSKINGVSFNNNDKCWVVSITGFKREYFKIKEKAEERAIEIRLLKDHSSNFIPT